jgi:hypothetical protein
VAALGVGALVLPVVAAASAEVPDEGGGSGSAAVVPHDPEAPNGPQYDPRYEVNRTQASGAAAGTADDAGVEVVQASASALAGAGIACGVMWLYRRRHAPAG